MKNIQAIVRASKFDAVKDALSEKGINFFTFYEVKGYGHQKGEEIHYRGSVYDVGYIARIKLEILVSEDYVDSATDAIITAAKTGEKGDGLIFVTEVSKLTNIRTGLTNGEAINI